MEPGFRLESALSLLCSVLPVLEIINNIQQMYMEFLRIGCAGVIYSDTDLLLWSLYLSRRAVNKYVSNDSLLANTGKCH